MSLAKSQRQCCTPETGNYADRHARHRRPPVLSLTAVYAVAVIAGFVLVVAWVIASGVSMWVEGWEFTDPDRRFGKTGRSVVAGVFGLGIAGMSATYAGWPVAAALVAAVAGAGALVFLARWLAPTPGSG